MLFGEELVDVFFELRQRGGVLVAFQQDFGTVGVKFPAFAQRGERAAGVGFRGDAQVNPLVRVGEGKRRAEEEQQGFHSHSCRSLSLMSSARSTLPWCSPANFSAAAFSAKGR